MKNLNQKGQALIFVTLAFALLLFFVGLATDGGRAYLLRAELVRTVDSAAIAAAAKLNSGGLSAATTAACDAARMNGFTACGSLQVTQVTVNDALGNPKTGVKVRGAVSTPTIFVAAGKFFGCGSSCNQINVSAESVAVSGGTLDLVMNLDDTASMSSGGWLGPMKTGANALVDAVLPVSGSSPALLAMVPFRGCYNTTGNNNCKKSQDYPTGSIASLTSSPSQLHNAINALPGTGGSGTNVCEGLTESRLKLFQSGLARTTSQKFLVLLSDTDMNYSQAASFASCRPTSGGTANYKVNLLTYNVAQDIKNGTNVGTTGQLAGQTVKVFVIYYGADATGTVPANCTPPPTGTTSWNTTPKNLARCIASEAGDLYFAPTPSEVTAAFQQIIDRLPLMLVN
ncbi:MAG TPA: Tad domain-containing protein [Candidatus Binatia bacterium]